MSDEGGKFAVLVVFAGGENDILQEIALAFVAAGFFAVVRGFDAFLGAKERVQRRAVVVVVASQDMLEEAAAGESVRGADYAKSVMDVDSGADLPSAVGGLEVSVEFLAEAGVVVFGLEGGVVDASGGDLRDLGGGESEAGEGVAGFPFGENGNSGHRANKGQRGRDARKGASEFRRHV